MGNPQNLTFLTSNLLIQKDLILHARTVPEYNPDGSAAYVIYLDNGKRMYIEERTQDDRNKIDEVKAALKELPHLAGLPSGDLFFSIERVLWSQTIEDYYPSFESAYIISFDNGHTIDFKDEKTISEVKAVLTETPGMSALPSGDIFFRPERVISAMTDEEYFPNGDPAFVVWFDVREQLVITNPNEIREFNIELARKRGLI